MYKIFFSCLVLFLASCVGNVETDSPVEASQKTYVEKLNKYFTTLAKLKKFNGGILVQKDGQTIIHEVYNMEGDVTSSLRANKNSQFDIHSISKLMAQACVVQLEGENLISRHDKLSKYIPDFPNGDGITIQNLIDNQSGLPRGLSDVPGDLIDKSPTEMVELIKREKLLFDPGSETLYSNLGYQVLYFIIGEITEKPFVEYLRESIFNPLEMNDSGAHFFLDKSNLRRPVTNHEEDDGKIKTVPNYNNESKNQAVIYSTLEDLSKFINYAKEEPIRSALINNAGNIGWSGGGDGILSHANASLELGYDLMLFSNYDEINFGQILNTVEKIMTDQSYELPREINRKAIQLDRKIMEQYVGKYDMAEFNHDEFEIRIENDSFAFYQNGEMNAMLMAETDSTFFNEPKAEDYFLFRKTTGTDFKLIYFYKGIGIEGLKK